MTPPDTAVELRVLTGPQAGAAVALTPGATIDVGSLQASGCQVVLRDPRVAEQRLRLHVRFADVRIEVLVGDVDMAGQVLSGPCSVDWPHFLPVRIGDTVIAVGAADSARWSQVLAVAEAAPRAGLSLDPSPAAPNPAVTAPAPAPRRSLESWLAVGGAALAAGALGLMAFVSLATPPRAPAATAAQRLERLLAAPDFRGLSAARSTDGRLRVSGSLLRLGDRTRLDRELADAGLDATVDVSVGEQIAHAVRDVYRMNGVPTEAAVPTTLADVGRVAVQTRSADAERLSRIEATVRQDVPGLRVLEVENTVPPSEPVATAVVDDPGKRIASIVPGDAAYVVTVDGTRYFTGALLPSGHRIASIDETEVHLEKDGKASSLRF